MPTRLTLKNKKFFRELENGNYFTLNPSSFGNHLKGSVMNRVKMTADVSINTYVEIQQQDINFFRVLGNEFFLDSDTYNFLNQGLWFDDEIKITYGFNSGNFAFLDTITANITSITEKRLVFLGTEAKREQVGGTTTTSPTLPDLTQLQGDIFTNLRITLSSESLDLQYKYNLQEQLDSLDFEGLQNGSESSFLVKTISTDTQGDWSNTNKAHKNGSLKCSFINATTDSYSIPTDTVFNYEIEHDFITFPYYIEGYEYGSELPATFKDTNTLRYVADYGFRRGYNNPNTEITGIDDNGLGSVGFLDETFNGFQNRYFVTSYSIEDLSGNPLESINVAEPNILKFRIETDKLTGGFSDNLHHFVIYVSKLPQVEEYTFNNSEDFETVFGYGSSFGRVEGGFQSLTGYFSSQDFTTIDNSYVEVSIQTNFPADYINKTEDGDEYIIAFEIGDSTQNINDSDSINLLLERNTFSKDVNIQGLVNTNSFSIKRTSDNSGFTDYKGWIQHGLEIENNFSMNLDNRGVIEDISVGLLSQNGGTFFDVYRYNFDLSGIVTNGNVQNINFLDSQNYKLPENSPFNSISLNNTGQTVANNEDYTLKYGLKVPYQDWQALNFVDPVFYDTSKELNGFNLNSSNYDTNGFSLKFFLDITASQDGIQTLYRSLSPSLEVLNFGEDGNDPSLWSGTIETFNANGDNLDGSVLTNQETFIKVTFNYPAPLTDIFAAVRIGEERHGGNAIDELTNKTSYPSNNRVIPLDGETSLKVTDNGTSIVLECKTNLEQLENTNYILCAEVFEIDAVSLAAYSDGYNTGYDI